MAPEVFEKRYGLSSDVFSFGVLMYLLVFKQEPFPFQELDEYQQLLAERKRLVFPLPVPAILEELMRDCLAYDSGSRPSFESICSVLKKCLEGEGEGE